MKSLKYLTIGLCFCLSACSSAHQEVIHTIDAAEAKTMLDQDADAVIVLDVRTQAEYEEGHLPHAQNLPLDAIDQAASLFEKDAVLMVYCRSGARSAQAAQRLKEAGFTNIYDMGGIIDWPYDIVK